jgi:hypothetical protein
MAFHSRTQWHAIAREAADSGERWSIIWDTTRRDASEGRNTALEKFEAAALDRARHLLRMGFIVYEIREPQGSVFLEEAGIKARLGLRVQDGEPAPAQEPDSAI